MEGKGKRAQGGGMCRGMGKHNTRNNKSGKVRESCLEELPAKEIKDGRRLAMQMLLMFALCLCFRSSRRVGKMRTSRLPGFPWVYSPGQYIKLISGRCRNCNFSNTIFAVAANYLHISFTWPDVRQELRELVLIWKVFLYSGSGSGTRTALTNANVSRVLATFSFCNSARTWVCSCHFALRKCQTYRR